MSDLKPNVTVVAILVVVGGFVASFAPALPANWAEVMLCGVLAGVVCKLLGRAGLAITVGFTWFVVQATLFEVDRWPPERWNEEREGVFKVTDFVTGNRNRFSMLVSPDDLTDVPQKIRLSWYRSDVRPQLGERWHWRVRLRPPGGAANPGGFDYERWLWATGVGATGYVVSGSGLHQSAETAPNSIAGRRLALRQRLYEALPDSRSRSVIVALMLGSRSDFSADTRDLFVRTATSHLMAISGLHIGLVGVFSLWLLRIVSAPLLLLSSRPLSRVPVAMLAFAPAVAYGLLAGATLPTQRAVFMLGLALCAWASARSVALHRLLAITAACLYFRDPASLYGASYYLSFGAVGLLLILAGRDKGMAVRKRFQAVRWQWLLSLLSLPITAALFGQFALTGPLANILMIPYFSLLIVPTLLLSIVLLHWQWASYELLEIAHALIAYALLILDAIGSSDRAVYQVAAVSPINILGALAAAVIILSPFRVGARLFVGLASLVLVDPRGAPAVPLACVRLHLLDVGQGQALVLKTRAHAMLYDTGPRYGSGGTAAEQIIQPALQRLAIQPDTIVVSHADADHAGGLDKLVEFYPNAEILFSDKTPPFKRCEAGVKWQWDGVSFEVLYPPQDQVVADTNSRSCVLKVSSGAHSVLLTGDIGVAQERALLAQHAQDLSTTIVLVPHHGSESSSSPEFVAALDADFAWVSAGYRNRWNFPRPAVVARYADVGTVAQSTGDAGMLSAILCPNSSFVDSGYRAAHPAIYRRKANTEPVDGPSKTEK